MSNDLNFTKRAIEALPLPFAGQRATYQDTKVTGLELRVTSTGTMTFCVRRKVKGKAERITLGRYPAMTPEQARSRAAEVNGTIAAGRSPVTEKKREKLAAKTLGLTIEEYIGRRTLKPQTVFDIRRCAKEVYREWTDKPLTSLTPDMISKRHKTYGEAHSEARANLAMRYLRAILNHAIDNHLDEHGKPIIIDNAATRAMKKAWFRVDRRQTVIKPHELEAWTAAVMALPSEDHRDYFMFLLLTGLRRQEALDLTWHTVDLTGRTFTVLDPKNHQDHTLPLSDYLAAMLTRRKAAATSAYVFADTAGRRVSNFRYAQASIEKSAGVRFTPHDLRRTFATIAESLDIPAYALKRLLNHANGADVTAGYIVANVERLREPMQRVTDYVLKAGGLKPSADVIQIRAQA
ncbi:tyrosine-type recombinase/integrase [Methylotetracoccus oryzae]|uniref:tyrosine-type recombinase/integrase n=1 Tax=Methylotetracoccus oryzae TaxID=1919059 RepID=UPI00111A61B0|nr:integrase family protein [Methylotetracoccus oryzae]